jgi:transcriptional regulator with XRE-family HTH domain
MKERLLEFLRAENKSSAQFAEEIGVQPSGISHILSGRNNPSLDFVLKMLEKYQFLSTDWLLFGKGTMYKDNKTQTLFEENTEISTEAVQKPFKSDKSQPDLMFKHLENDELQRDHSKSQDSRSLKVLKIVWFYENNRFEEYYPSR